MNRRFREIFTPEVLRVVVEALAILNIILLFMGTLALWRISTLNSENKNRIADIQQSRIASCQKTYQAFRDIFHPFVSNDNPKAQEFYDLIDAKKRNCLHQTRVKNLPVENKDQVRNKTTP